MIWSLPDGKPFTKEKAVVHFVVGDLFANRYRAEMLAHGCNCIGSMGGGIAAAFAARFPQMEEQYMKLCEKMNPEELAGKAFYWVAGDFIVCNMFTQKAPGANAEYSLIEQSFLDCKQMLIFTSIKTLAMPAIGSGIGGLDLEKVKSIAAKVFSDWDGNLYFYEKYAKE